METSVEKKLKDAGYRMLGDDTSIEGLIEDTLKIGNTRYLKAIPFLVYKYDIDISRLIGKTKRLELLNAILDITKRIFNELNIKKKIPISIKGDSKLKSQSAHKLDYKEFRDEFVIQLRNDKSPSIIDRQKIDEEMNLKYSLSQLFTKKEKQIIKRLQEEKPVSRTDYEYYSRKTKKKIQAIIALHDFASSIYPKTPKYNQELFELKNLLEEWLQKEWKQDWSIEMFSISDNTFVIRYRDKEDEAGTFIRRLNKIKDKKILTLLNKYKEYDFSLD